MVRAFLLAASLTGCLVEMFTDSEAGTVYQCAGPDGSVKEWCYFDDSADELGELSGRMCERTDRRWPKFTNALSNGCAYACKPHDGCNAKQGCYCEVASP